MQPVANPLEAHWRRFAEGMARVSATSRTSPEPSVDRDVNLDPDADIARTVTYESDTSSHGMTLEELLGPEVDELIRANKRPMSKV